MSINVLHRQKNTKKGKQYEIDLRWNNFIPPPENFTNTFLNKKKTVTNTPFV